MDKDDLKEQVSRLNGLFYGSLFRRDKEVLELIRRKGAKPMALKINNKSGQPAHPLYLKANAQPIAL